MIRFALGLCAVLVLPGGCATLFGEEPRAPLDRCAGFTAPEFEEADLDVISQKLSDWLNAHRKIGEEFECW